MPDELEKIGGEVAREVTLLAPAEPKYEDLDFPQAIVDRQLALGSRSERELTELIADASITLAAKMDGVTPWELLDLAKASYAFGEEGWESVKARIRQLWHRAGLLG